MSPQSLPRPPSCHANPGRTLVRRVETVIIPLDPYAIFFSQPEYARATVRISESKVSVSSGQYSSSHASQKFNCDATACFAAPRQKSCVPRIAEPSEYMLQCSLSTPTRRSQVSRKKPLGLPRRTVFEPKGRDD